MFSLSDFELNALLRLPPLKRAICHGYANCCACDECRERLHAAPAAVPAPQPWEPKAA